jgi:hypothetical protein
MTRDQLERGLSMPGALLEAELQSLEQQGLVIRIEEKGQTWFKPGI